MSVKEFAEKFIKAQDEAIFNDNMSALLVLEDPDVVFHLQQGVELVGWEGHKQLITGIREAVSNFHHEWKYLTGEGNIFALSRRASGKIAGEIPGFKLPIGEKYIADSIMVFRLENEKIVVYGKTEASQSSRMQLICTKRQWLGRWLGVGPR